MNNLIKLGFVMCAYFLIFDVLAQGINEVRGVGSCAGTPSEDTRHLATKDAENKCKSKVIRISDWKEGWTYCYGPGHKEWEGFQSEALFQCL